MMDVDFVAVLRAAGIPTTQAELETQWRGIVTSTGSLLSNDDRMSPFWRLITAAVTAPVLWLINFIAVTVMPNAYVKYATGVFLDLLADAVNLERKPATKAQGVITFTLAAGATAQPIPMGFIIQTAAINGVVYQMVTTEAKTFPVGSSTVDVPVEAIAAGSAYNLASGYYTVTPNPLANITATNGLYWLTTPASDVEVDDDLRARVKNQFGTAAKFHTDSVYRFLIAQFQGVKADAIYFVHDAPRGAGTANAFVLFDFSAPVSTYLATINNYITAQGYHGHGDDLIVYQMPEHSTTLTVTVYVELFLSDAEKAAVSAKVADIIHAAFRDNTAYSVSLTLPYSRFSFSKLAEEIHLLVPEVKSLVFSLGDIVTDLWIPRLNTLTLTILETS